MGTRASHSTGPSHAIALGLTTPGWVQKRQLPAPPHKARQVRPVAPPEREQVGLFSQHNRLPPAQAGSFARQHKAADAKVSPSARRFAVRWASRELWLSG